MNALQTPIFPHRVPGRSSEYGDDVDLREDGDSDGFEPVEELGIPDNPSLFSQSFALRCSI